MRGPEEWPSSRSNPADRIRLTGPAATLFFIGTCKTDSCLSNEALTASLLLFPMASPRLPANWKSRLLWFDLARLGVPRSQAHMIQITDPPGMRRQNRNAPSAKEQSHGLHSDSPQSGPA